MEKLGVAQVPPAKTSSAGPPRCPLCGREAEQRGSILVCPVHGTAPWEGLHREDG